MKIILPLLLVPLASSLKPFDDHHVEIVQDFGDELLVREKRDSGLICKYKKGEWSSCDHLTQLVTRHDTIKKKSSSDGCASTRTLTRNCHEEQKEDNEISCTFKKSKEIPWTDCQVGGVRQKVLELVSQTGNGACPKQKLLSRKCKDHKTSSAKKEKKKKHKTAEHKAEKKKAKKTKKGSDNCKFGDWSVWGVCNKGSQQRTREITRGSDRPKCQKKAILTRSCKWFVIPANQSF